MCSLPASTANPKTLRSLVRNQLAGDANGCAPTLFVPHRHTKNSTTMKHAWHTVLARDGRGGRKEGGQTLWPALSKFLNGSIRKQSRLSGWLGPPAPCQPSVADLKFVYPIGIIARVDRTGHMLKATPRGCQRGLQHRFKKFAKILPSHTNLKRNVSEGGCFKCRRSWNQSFSEAFALADASG